jgi:hypothetical protein
MALLVPLDAMVCNRVKPAALGVKAIFQGD